MAMTLGDIGYWIKAVKTRAEQVREQADAERARGGK
jgi:hypothetical protein